MGCVGEDEAGHDLATTIQDIPQIQFLPILSKHRPTTVKTRYLSSGQQILRVDKEVTTPLDKPESDTLYNQAEKLMAECDILILSDYAKGCLYPELNNRLIEAARKAQIKVIIDPKSTEFEDYRGAYLLTPNLAELKKATGLLEDGLKAIEECARAVMQKCDIANMLVTLSARGMLLVTPDKAQHLPAQPCDVFDVSGAGDTVIAFTASGQITGLSLEESAGFANQGAALVVAKSGTASLAPGEILAQICAENRPISRDEGYKMVQRWRQQDLKIGFTNGCFDLLHAGHLHIVHKAAQQSDKLIIGLNADASVKRLKGEARPIQSEQIRGAILASLPFVDAVILFDEETPEQLIDLLKPDILSKGGDYSPDEIVGADIVKKAGGRVVTFPLLEGHSTTNFLKTSSL